MRRVPGRRARQARLSRVERGRPLGSIGIRRGHPLPADPELVEVIVLPPERALNCEVQAVERARRSNLDHAPDRGLDVADRHADLEEFTGWRGL